MKRLTILFFMILMAGCTRQLIEIGLIPREKENILMNRRYHWSLDFPLDNLHIYREEGVAADRDEIMDDVEDAYEDVLGIFENIDHEDTVTFFLVGSPKEMKRINGVENRVLTYPEKDIAFVIVENSKEDDFEMAFLQILSHHTWGPTQDWLSVGFSKYMSIQEETGASLYPEAVKLLEQDPINLNDLIHDFDRIPVVESEILAGSFVEFIIKNYSLEVLKALWGTGLLVDSDKTNQWDAEWKKAISKQ